MSNLTGLSMKPRPIFKDCKDFAECARVAIKEYERRIALLREWPKRKDTKETK